MLSQVLDSALTSVNSAYTSVNAAKDWVESNLSHTMSAPASPHTPVNKGEAGQWGDHNIDGALAAPPAAPPFGLATGVRRDSEATKTSDDRMKELRALLAGTTTPALPILPHGIINTSQEREPLSLSPTPSSADGSSPKSRIASLVESMRQRQETLQPDPSMASMNPVPLTPSITRPSPIAESTPAATPANGTKPPVVQQPPGIRLPEGLQPVVPPTPPTAPLTNGNVELQNQALGVAENASQRQKGKDDDGDANTVKSDDSKASMADSVFSQNSNISKADSVATSVGSGGKGK